jgi:hypothetical protein
MSVYSGFATRNQEESYNNQVVQMLRILAKRVSKFYLQQPTDEPNFRLTLKKVSPSPTSTPSDRHTISYLPWNPTNTSSRTSATRFCNCSTTSNWPPILHHNCFHSPNPLRNSLATMIPVVNRLHSASSRKRPLITRRSCSNQSCWCHAALHFKEKHTIAVHEQSHVPVLKQVAICAFWQLTI